MSYFHTGIRTIIGAESFHCPVRDGKEWDQLAMVIRLKPFTARALGFQVAGAVHSQSRIRILIALSQRARLAWQAFTHRFTRLAIMHSLTVLTTWYQIIKVIGSSLTGN